MREMQMKLWKSNDMYPERRQPGRTYIHKFLRNLLECANFEKSRPEKFKKNNDERNRNILRYLKEDSESST